MVPEIAKKMMINDAFLSRVLRLTPLEPEIVEAILDGRQADRTIPRALSKPLPLEWRAQQEVLDI